MSSSTTFDPGECALVSSSGLLLSRRDGAAIDAAKAVFRLNYAPIGGQYAKHVGNRTTVRFVKQSIYQAGRQRVNTSLAAKVLQRLAASEQDSAFGPELWLMNSRSGSCPFHPKAMLRYFKGRFSLPRSIPMRCVGTYAPYLCKQPNMTGFNRVFLKSTGGLLAVFHILRMVKSCTSVRLWGWGLGNEIEAWPYHYWSGDGTETDARTAADHYSVVVSGNQAGHDFRKEHRYIHDVLGRGSWLVTRAAFESICRPNETYNSVNVPLHSLGSRSCRGYRAWRTDAQCGMAHGTSNASAIRGVQAGSLAAAPSRVPSTSSAAYAFALLGRATRSGRAALLTSVALLERTSPSFPIVTLIGGEYVRGGITDPAVRLAIGDRITLLPVEDIPGVSCLGPLRKGSAFSNFTASIYTKLAIWNLTQYDAVLYLDTDAVVRRNLDHLLWAMLAHPGLREMRTPAGCPFDNGHALDKAQLPGGSTASAARRFGTFNTGVWVVRPNASTFSRLVAFLQRRSFRCITGVRSAANAFFRQRNLASSLHVLHAGYNLKADKGVKACLTHSRLTASDAFVVHFSEARKPWLQASPYTARDALEQAAFAAYNDTRHKAAERLAADND